MKLELKMIKTPSGYDIQIANKQNKSRGISGWNLSAEGTQDLVRQLMQLAVEIQSKIDFKDSE